jgi:hypothetical protein
VRIGCTEFCICRRRSTLAALPTHRVSYSDRAGGASAS